MKNNFCLFQHSPVQNVGCPPASLTNVWTRKLELQNVQCTSYILSMLCQRKKNLLKELKQMTYIVIWMWHRHFHLPALVFRICCIKILLIRGLFFYMETSKFGYFHVKKMHVWYWTKQTFHLELLHLLPCF